MSRIVDVLDRHLVADWRCLHRMASVWLIATNGVVVAAWAAFPAEIREVLSPLQVKILLAFIVISTMFARAVKQRTNQETAYEPSRHTDERIQETDTNAAADRIASGG